jgi:ATP-dependent Clp protease ATP-binding subunit ClpC
MLLQIMEEGRLTDSFGRKVDFRNTILIMTSNLGAEVIRNQSGLGFRRGTDEQTYETMKKQLMEEIEKSFRPEFVNRVDDIIVFRPLTRKDLSDIVHLEFGQVAERAAARGIRLELTPEALELLLEAGYNPDFGARPLRRAIERMVEDPLSERLLRGQFQQGDSVAVRPDGKGLTFEVVRREPPKEAAPAQPSEQAR